MQVRHDGPGVSRFICARDGFHPCCKAALWRPDGALDSSTLRKRGFRFRSVQLITSGPSGNSSGSSLEPLGGLAFSESPDAGERCLLTAARHCFAGFPVIDGLTTDAYEPAEVRCRQSQPGTKRFQSLGTETHFLGLFLDFFFGLFDRDSELSLQQGHLTLELRYLAAMRSIGLAKRIHRALDLFAGKPCDLALDNRTQIGHGRRQQ